MSGCQTFATAIARLFELPNRWSMGRTAPALSSRRELLLARLVPDSRSHSQVNDVVIVLKRSMQLLLALRAPPLQGSDVVASLAAVGAPLACLQRAAVVEHAVANAWSALPTACTVRSSQGCLTGVCAPSYSRLACSSYSRNDHFRHDGPEHVAEHVVVAKCTKYSCTYLGQLL